MNNIGKLWRSYGYKAEEMQTLVGVSQNQYMFQNLKDNITFKNIGKIADFLDVEIMFLIREVASPQMRMFIVAYQNMSLKDREKMLNLFIEEGLVNENLE